MSIINRYVRKTVAMACLVIFVGFISLDLVFRLIGEIDNVTGDYTLWLSIIFELCNTPARVYEMMPIIGLIGCLTGLGSLANTSELMIMRTSGISTFQLLFMAVKPTLIFMLCAMFIGEYIAPESEQYARNMRAEARGTATTQNLRYGKWLREGDDFIFVNVVDPSGKMFGVNIFQFDENKQLRSLLQGKEAIFQNNQWQISNVTISEFIRNDTDAIDGLLADQHQDIKHSQVDSYVWQSDLKPRLLTVAAAIPEDLGMRDLWSYMRYLKAQNLNSSEYELVFWEKFFYPLIMFGLVLIGIAFVFGPLRQASMGYRVFWGILTGVLFKTLQDTLAPLSVVFGFSPIVAILIPILACLILGTFFLLRAK